MNENQNDLFEGIPGLADTEGLENYMNQQAAQSFGNGDIPPMLQQNTAQQNGNVTQPQAQPQVQTQPQAQPQPQNVVTINGVNYTPAQLEQIVAQNNAMRQQMAGQRMPNASQVQSQNNQSGYTPQQSAIIKELIDRGVPMERIQAALNANRAEAQMNSRIQNVENYLQQQAYAREEQAFIDKMTNFGDKFGLSEDDLVEFANVALSKGINVAHVTDVEAVFRAIYPEQYAIRTQRMSAPASSQMYGGSSVAETPRAVSNKLEDAYVESFLKSAMPNQYRK